MDCISFILKLFSYPKFQEFKRSLVIRIVIKNRTTRGKMGMYTDKVQQWVFVELVILEETRNKEEIQSILGDCLMWIKMKIERGPRFTLTKNGSRKIN